MCLTDAQTPITIDIILITFLKFKNIKEIIEKLNVPACCCNFIAIIGLHAKDTNVIVPASAGRELLSLNPVTLVIHRATIKPVKYAIAQAIKGPKAANFI